MMGRFLTMKNKLGFNHYKPELEGLKQEKEDAKLEMQFTKSKLVATKHDLEMAGLQNQELRRKIYKLSLDNEELNRKRLKAK